MHGSKSHRREKAKCWDRNTAQDALIAPKRRRGKVGRSPEGGDVGEAPCGADGAPNGEDQKVPEQKIRDVRGVGLFDRGVLMETPLLIGDGCPLYTPT